MILIYKQNDLGHRVYLENAHGEPVEFDTIEDAFIKAISMGSGWVAVDLDNQMSTMTGLY